MDDGIQFLHARLIELIELQLYIDYSCVLANVFFTAPNSG